MMPNQGGGGVPPDSMLLFLFRLWGKVEGSKGRFFLLLRQLTHLQDNEARARMRFVCDPMAA